jgi:hypothetical protein
MIQPTVAVAASALIMLFIENFAEIFKKKISKYIDLRKNCVGK